MDLELELDERRLWRSEPAPDVSIRVCCGNMGMDLELELRACAAQAGDRRDAGTRAARVTRAGRSTRLTGSTAVRGP
jgi:hypothetical protein